MEWTSGQKQDLPRYLTGCTLVGERVGVTQAPQWLRPLPLGLPYSALPDPSLLQLAQAGISLQDLGNSLLLLLCQEAEIQ